MNFSENQTGSSAALVAALPDALSTDEDERRALVRRVASSRHFAKAHQLRDILLYLAERAITEPSAAIREHEIGCIVLGRKPDFNPHEDNIVRVQISHLRKRLDDYFAADGSCEIVRVSVPKGGYMLRFESRPLPVSIVPVDVVPVNIAPEIAPAPQPEAAPAVRWSRFRYAVLACALLAAAGSFAWRRYVPSRQVNTPVRIPEDDPLWPRFFAGQTTNMVVADTCLVTLQDILDTDIAVSDYVNGRYPGSLLDKVPDQALQRALRLISTRQYTSLADLNSAQSLSELSHRYTPNQPVLRYARHMNVRDFKTGNFILMGSRRGIPWVSLFESQLNFSMEEDRGTKSYYFRNRAPRQGEPDAWYPETKADTTVETYADVALVPNLGGTGYVLILSGIGMEASEAAGEFVASAEFQKALLAILPGNGNRPRLRCFELLLRTRAVAGAARSSQVVTSRILNSPVPGL